MSRIELPSMLAFDRKLETSDALMFSGIWEDAQNCENGKRFLSLKGITVQRKAPMALMKITSHNPTQYPRVMMTLICP